MARGYYSGTEDKSQHRGNWNIREGKEVSEHVALSVIDAVSHACAILTARGQRPDFEAVKKINNAALFGAQVAEANIEYINGKVREQRKAQPQQQHRGSPPDGFRGAHYRGETDELY